MRVVFFCFLLGGCGVLDGIADASGGAYQSNRVYLGEDSIRVVSRSEMDRYTCGAKPMVCGSYGVKWECSCQIFSLTSF